MTKFQNTTFSVGPKQGEKISDAQWEIAVGLRCPTCTSKFVEGSTRCSNPLCGETVPVNQPDEAAPDWIEKMGGTFTVRVPAKPAPSAKEFVEETRNMKLAIGYFDGGSSNNPGLGASAWALEYTNGDTVTGMKKLGVTTNNKAEYSGLIELMTYALDKGVARIRIHGDSQLIVNQTLGKWKVKEPELKPLVEEAKRLATKFEMLELVWIPREDNGTCDAMVKQKIKEQKTNERRLP